MERKERYYANFDSRQYHVIDMMLDVRVGDTVAFTILRDGKKMTVNIDITEDCLAEY